MSPGFQPKQAELRSLSILLRSSTAQLDAAMGQSHHCYHKVFPPIPFLALLVMSIASSSVPSGQAVNVLLSDHFVLSGNHYLNVSDYYLVMQTDCNLVLYEGARAILSSNTSGRGEGCSLRMQLDGDMAVYNSTLASGSAPIWESKTPFAPGSFFVLMPNGSLSIFDFGNVTPIASLRETLMPVADAQAPGALANFSYPYSPHLAWKPSTPLDGSPYMPVGYYLDEGCSLQSLAGAFNLTLEYDCNLQSLALLPNGSSTTVWETKTTSFGPEKQCRLMLTPDGNLQIQTVGSGKLVWGSNVTGNASVNWAVMVDRLSGDVMVRDLLDPGNVLWSTSNLPKATDAGGGKKKFPLTITFLTGVVGAAFVLTMVAVSSIIYFLWSGAGIAEAEKELQRRLGTKKRKCTTLAPATIKQATRNFERKIGHGGFGDVFYGKLPDGQEIAVKVLSAKSHQSKQEFFNEIELLTVVHHKYLVALIGYSLARNHRYMLVYENLSGGDLRRRLQGDGAAGNPLSWKERMAIILQIAEAIEYLHNKCSPAIIHRDIKSNNILLTKNLVAKVADFGLSKLRASDQEVASSHVTTLVRGTPGYLDPDYHESGMLTEKSDVYAFGIVLMEILTGQHHYCLTEKVLEAWSSKQFEDLADPFLKGDYDRDVFQKLVQLSLSCACKKGSQRPSMAVIVHRLQETNHINNSEADKHEEIMAQSKDYEVDVGVIHPVAESSSTGFSLKSSSNLSTSK